MRQKWRPALAMVLAGALAGTLAMALGGLFVLRFLGPELGFRNAAFAIAVLIAASTGILGLMLVRLLLGPMRALARYAAAVRADAQAEPEPPDRFGTREIGATAGAVIEMADALRTRETTIRSYSDHVTHELKGPVSAMIAASELLQDRGLAPPERQLVDQIAGAAAQMNSELDALRRVVRAREADYRGTSLLADVLPALEAKAPGLVIAATGAKTPVPLAADGLTLILEHMVSNAAAHGATRIDLSVEPGSIDICDNGSGIADADLANVFKPFFTTRRQTGGTGMGLAIVRSVLTAHGGTIRVFPSDAGARFRIGFAR